MKRQVILSPEAFEDIQAIYDFLERSFGATTASRATRELVAHCRSIGAFPESGTKRDDLRKGIRTIGYRRRATIAFRIEDRTVTILRVFPAGRDIRFDPGAF